MLWLILGIVFLITLYILYNKWTWIHEYWNFKGIPGPNPRPFVGNMLPNILGQKSMGELCVEWTEEFKDKSVVGLYNFLTPVLLLNSLDYVETVLIREFSYFSDRTPPPPSEVNLSDQFLFIMSGAKWKALRSKLTPVFTTGKLKGMVLKMKECFQQTSDEIDKKLSVEMQPKDFIHKYVIDATAQIVFGIESAHLSNPKSEFMEMCQKMFKFDWKRFVQFMIYFNFPKLAATLKIPFVPTEQAEYFQKIVEQTFRQRRASGYKRNDIIQLLLELKDKGNIDVETWDEADDYLKMTEQTKTVESVEMTEALLTSQAMIFLTTGFDTMSTAITFTLVELSQNRLVMDKLTDEIDRVMTEHKDFTYDAIKDMKYLEMCLMEAMRLHPAIPAMYRQCTKHYTFDNGLQIEKGFMVLIPVLSIHLDPSIYPEPNKFKPERFETPPKPATYLPFGDGPRVCIAKRFAMLEMKMMLARLLHSYEVRLNPKTKLPVQIEKRNFLLKPSSPIFFNLTKRVHPNVNITFN